jgi:hypothetical protein
MRSRARKQQQVQELIAEASRLQAENARVKDQINACMAELDRVNGEKAVLRACYDDLAGRLQALQQAGAAVDIPANSYDPWQPPFVPAQDTLPRLDGFQVAGVAVGIPDNRQWQPQFVPAQETQQTCNCIGLDGVAAYCFC